MSELESQHPDVYEKFQNGLVIRQTNQFWTVLSCDLVVKQTSHEITKKHNWLDS